MRYLGRCLAFILVTAAYSCEPEKEYTNKDVVKNYDGRQMQIRALKRYYNAIVPKDKFVEIEFDREDHIYRLGIYAVDSLTKGLVFPGFLEWDLETTSGKVKNAIAALGWNRQTLRALQQKLDSANCTSAESGEPCKIGFQRRDFGKYYYLIFDKPPSDSLRSFYEDHCPFRLYNDSTVFNWGTGVFGSACYPVR